MKQEGKFHAENQSHRRKYQGSSEEEPGYEEPGNKKPAPNSNTNLEEEEKQKNNLTCIKLKSFRMKLSGCATCLTNDVIGTQINIQTNKQTLGFQ